LRFIYSAGFDDACTNLTCISSLATNLLTLCSFDQQKRSKMEEVQRKVGVVLLNGQKLEVGCDPKAVCKDVFDMVVAHIGLVEHHLFALAYLKGKLQILGIYIFVSQKLAEYGVHFHRVLPEKRSQTGIMLGVYSKGVLIFDVLNGNRNPVLKFPWRETKKISFAVRGGDTSARTPGPISLAQTLSTRSNPDHLKRISYSEVALNKAPSGSVLVHEELHLPGYNPLPSTVFPNPQLMSRSHHNLAQMPESEENPLLDLLRSSNGRLTQAQLNQASSNFQQHQRASSDTDSISHHQDKSLGAAFHSSPSWHHSQSKKESDSSSIEDNGQAYVVDSTPIVPQPPKSSFNSPKPVRRLELEIETSSEKHRGTVSPSPPLHGAGTPSSTSSPVRQPTSLNSQDSRTSSSAMISQPSRDRVQQALERVKVATTAETTTSNQVPEPKTELNPSPPALPPKTRKVKPSAAPSVSEQSDRGDTDMDEETYSGSQEKLKAKKVRSLWL
ncbi:hypothetical protein GOODEAATRI_003290, partial [Goodea atripinnis]